MSSSFLILGDGHEKNSNYGVNNQVELQQSKLWPNSEFNKKQCMYYFSACKPTSDKTCSHSVSNMDAAATDCKKKKMVRTLEFIQVTQNTYTITKVLTYCNLHMLIHNIHHHQGYKAK